MIDLIKQNTHAWVNQSISIYTPSNYFLKQDISDQTKYVGFNSYKVSGKKFFYVNKNKG